MREQRTFEIKKEDAEKFDQIMKALGHDEPEETFVTLIQLGRSAISVSDAQHRTVRIIGGNKQEGPKCDSCGYSRVLYTRETSVMIGKEEKC